MSADHPEIIIIKRRSHHEEEHHGGAWKIAFADFMTAMMAFFLVLWIINATDKNTKTLIARYFNPVRLEDPARSHKGIHGTEQPVAKGEVDDESSTKDAPQEATAPRNQEAARAASAEAGKREEQVGGEAKTAVDPAAPKPTMSESQLFADPYASLDRIARAASGDRPPDNAAQSWAGSIDSFRDPFVPEVAAATTSRPNSAKDGAVEANGQNGAAADKADSVVAPPPVPNRSLNGSQSGLDKAGAQTTKSLPQEIADRIGKMVGAGPSIEVRAEKDGVLISLTDQLNFSMFAVGSAEPQAKLIKAVENIAHALKDKPGSIVVRGHTDGHPYKSGTYDNWRLSSARAQMVYYMLTRGGMPASRIGHIEGYADHRLKDPSHPFAAVNRRIEIFLREDHS